MKTGIRCVAAAILFFIGLSVSAWAQVAGEVIPGRYIVQVAEGVDPQELVESYMLRAEFVFRRALSGFAGEIPAGLVGMLSDDPRVVSVVPDRVVRAFQGNRPGGGGGGGSSGQVLPAGVERIGADQVWGTANGLGIGVAVVDTGLDLAHADFQGGLGESCFGAFSGGSCQDNNSHGTHVGGIIGARNNGIDVVGVAPESTLYSVKVLNQNGSGSDSTVINGLEWIQTNAQAVNPKILVANMSLGRPASSDADDQPMRTAVANLTSAGIVVVVAAGNDCSKEAKDFVPARFPEVIAVASTTAVTGTNACKFLSSPIAADTASFFTTDGKLSSQNVGVTISAPGAESENVSRGCMISSVGILSLNLGGGTTRKSGTSMAAPHVAALVALMLQKNGSMTPEQVRSKLRSSAAQQGLAPYDSPSSCYSFDGEREGVVWAPGALN